MTHDENAMMGILGKGKPRAIKSRQLQAHFGYSDVKIRDIIRVLIYDYGIAIVGDTKCGFYIANSDEEINACDSNLYSRAIKIMRRRKQVHDNYWNNGKQEELFKEK